ncbi:hypothetical protein QN386_08490 [Pseudomonas sp. CCI3.2]|uniref:hypothetical protein n=1 Tax=unclassified Pseudomonas TaxID=196821 RepID=UPI002AC8F09C|nr:MULTISPECIES: hypothetical protein [unclassified Pseudomonas]MEB0077650.1 hypothetical protein [Pseudomonas sp. MH10out]MEB0093914.1 hypothetical protein [Pseudomonas sp. CCI4.2]MEB0101356.1 hypothetical protein [Pseudomonas sp. CCI3.2]MEB0131463.1 hypothetical protein [Pseudomonas sp. CCI2.4]MEB0158473.1 hypothetical protein [Pseudomonas sp. AH2 (2023)]
MDISLNCQGDVQYPVLSMPVPTPNELDEDTEKPDQDIDTFTDDDNPPPQDWKHPDDGKSLSDQDVEWPLKP